ncbi:PAS domain-containing sensor histidine kinase [Pararhodonellum marinum]|uniref:PAS domain-containing sensor histidine kinase n=1 Tax=Pararhodonellum marinum TaxID=2755358 RepID=UPI00188F569E|nr:PAS domain-containing sensor histidine kinase [Pararhodonellum marinum]
MDKDGKISPLLEAITQSTPDLIYVFDLNHRFIYANKALLSMWGRTWEESIGKNLLEIGYEPWHADMHEKEINEVIATKKNIRGEVSFTHAKLGKRIYDYIFVPVLDTDGNVEAVAGTTRDITEHVEARKQLEDNHQRYKESEERFRTLANHIPLMSFITAPCPEATITYWNKAYLDYTGQEFEEAIGRNWHGIVHPDDLEAGFRIYQTAFEKRKPFSIPSLRMKRYDGEYRWHFISANPRYLPDGTFMGYIGIGMDIHEQKKSQDALKESEERFRIFSNNIQNLAWIADGQGNIFWYNQRWLDYTGLSLEEMKGWGWQKAHHPDHVERIVEISKKLWVTNEPFELTFPLRGADGTYRWFLTRGVPIRDETGEIYRWIGTNTDIDEKVKIENQLKEREEKFHSLVQTLPQLVWVTDEKGNAEFSSHRWKEYTGIEPINEKDWRKIVHPDDFDGINEAWLQSLETGDVYSCDIRLKSKEGQYRWHSVKGRPVFDKDHRIVSWVGAFTDIHSEKTISQELEEIVASRIADLKESEEKFYKLFDLSPVCKTLSDIKSGKILMVNDEFTNVFGFTAEESLGKTSIELGMIDPTAREVIIQQLNSYGKMQNQEVEFIRKSGEKFSALASAEIIKIGNSQYYLSAISDITERKIAEQNIAQKNIELQKLNKELQSFAYISSHDLQEPLRKIQTFASRIKEKEENNLSEYGRDSFKRMQDAAKRMQTLIQDLLAYSHTSNVERKFESVDLNKILEEVKDDFYDEIMDKHAIIEASELSVVHVIPFQIRQLFYNLIGNALKFSIPSRPPHIRIKSEIVSGDHLKNGKFSKNEQYYHITVEDNGIGFEQQYSEKIFEVFQRLHGRREYSGTGIGLSVVKKIVETHNGFVSATGEINKGATFDIFLPVTKS